MRIKGLVLICLDPLATEVPFSGDPRGFPSVAQFGGLDVWNSFVFVGGF